MTVTSAQGSSSVREACLPGRAMLGLAVLSWLILMAPVLSAGPLVLDEHISYWMADSGLEGSTLERSLNYAAVPPLSIWVQQVFTWLLGKTEFVLRLPSILGALGAIGVCYAAGRDLRDRTTGGVAALLVVWNPEALDEVRIARCYGLVLLLGAVVLWAAVRWARSPRSVGWMLAWSLSGAALMWTHYTGGLLVIVSAVVVAGCWLRHGELDIGTLARLGVAVAVVAVLCARLVPAVSRLAGWAPFLNYSPPDASLWDAIGPFWWAGLPAGLVLSWLVSRGKTAAAPRGAVWLAGACSLVPLVLFAAVSAGELTSLANPRYRVAYAPAAACFAALLVGSRRDWRAAVCGAVVALAVAWSLSPAPPWELQRLESSVDREWWELNRHLAEEARPGEPILVQSGMVESSLVPAYFKDRVFQEYVAARVSRFYVETLHPRYGLPSLWKVPTGVTMFYRDLLSSWAGEPGAFWVASATDTDLNRNSLAGLQAIADSAGFEVTERRTWPNVTLLHYRRPSPAD